MYDQETATQEASPIDLLYPNCRKLPLLMFEAFIIDRDLQGISPDHWEKLSDEFYEIKGSKDKSDRSYLEANLFGNVLLLENREQLYKIIEIAYLALEHQPNALKELGPEIEKRIAPVREKINSFRREKKFSFTFESYKEDVRRCRSLDKTLTLRIWEDEQALENLKPKPGTEKRGNTNPIDEALVNYQQAFGGSIPDKSTMFTSTFATMLKQYDAYCEKIAAANAKKRNDY